MRSFGVAAVAGVLSCAALADDFRDQCRAVMPKLRTALEQAEKLQIEGKLDEANNGLLGAFPEPRTPAQNFMLANVLFKQDPARSYAMHKRVAEALPEN
ncbi:MAG TPA: hypothetical protein VFF65_01725, partial [Phycisphaerales bacterium]|nr:hypothetical protein [Phycisphaerales bacterium]